MARRHRVVVYLDDETAAALDDYQARHRREFHSASAALQHLLRRALLGAVTEDGEGLLAPALARLVREAAGREIQDRLAPLLKAQTERLAALLVRTDRDAVAAAKDAAVAAAVATALVEVVTGDPVGAQAVADEARLRAGAKYARREARAGRA